MPSVIYSPDQLQQYEFELNLLNPRVWIKVIVRQVNGREESLITNCSLACSSSSSTPCSSSSKCFFVFIHVRMSLPWLIVLLYVKTCQVELDKVASLVSRCIRLLDHHSSNALRFLSTSLLSLFYLWVKFYAPDT